MRTRWIPSTVSFLVAAIFVAYGCSGSSIPGLTGLFALPSPSPAPSPSPSVAPSPSPSASPSQQCTARQPLALSGSGTLNIPQFPQTSGTNGSIGYGQATTTGGAIIFAIVCTSTTPFPGSPSAEPGNTAVYYVQFTFGFNGGTGNANLMFGSASAATMQFTGPSITSVHSYTYLMNGTSDSQSGLSGNTVTLPSLFQSATYPTGGASAVSLVLEGTLEQK